MPKQKLLIRRVGHQLSTAAAAATMSAGCTQRGLLLLPFFCCCFLFLVVVVVIFWCTSVQSPGPVGLDGCGRVWPLSAAEVRGVDKAEAVIVVAQLSRSFCISLCCSLSLFLYLAFSLSLRSFHSKRRPLAFCCRRCMVRNSLLVYLCHTLPFCIIFSQFSLCFFNRSPLSRDSPCPTAPKLPSASAVSNKCFYCCCCCCLQLLTRKRQLFTVLVVVCTPLCSCAYFCVLLPPFYFFFGYCYTQRHKYADEFYFNFLCWPLPMLFLVAPVVAVAAVVVDVVPCCCCCCLSLRCSLHSKDMHKGQIGKVLYSFTHCLSHTHTHTSTHTHTLTDT